MPEGDTIYRAARNLRSALAGQRIQAAHGWPRFLDADQLVHRTIEQVESRGKHLLFHLQDGGAIHSHMGMTGSWHIYEAGQRWQKSTQQSALTLTMDHGYSAVCFTPKMLELISDTELRRHRWLNRLAPDLLHPEFGPQEISEILRRFRVHDATPIGEAIINQTILCGIGNVYKSELLFLHRTDPFLPVHSLDDNSLGHLVQSARRLMMRNLEGRPRQTRFGQAGSRVWVYDRSGDQCFECGFTIRMQRQGDLGRSTYFCARCQHLMQR